MKYYTSTSTADLPVQDSIVESVINKYKKRSQVGIDKYGTTMDRDDLSDVDWLRHAQEEVMDFSLYLEKLIVRKRANEINAVHKFMRALNITPSSSFEIADKNGGTKMVLIADLLNEIFKQEEQ